MIYFSTKEISRKWEISERRVRPLCSEGRIEGALKEGRNWRVPEDALKPLDARESSNATYCGLEYDFTSIDSDKRRIDQFRPFSPALASSLHEKLVVEWTYNSNAIEGNTLTLSETKVVLEGITIGGKTLVEHLETINHRDAILYVEDLVDTKAIMSEWNVRNIHSLILRGIDPGNAGRYRTENVVISGADHIPPSHELVAQLMQQLVFDYDHAWKRYHPVVRAALLHGEFVKIHPFTDGNGRTARLLLNFELMRNGYVPVIIPTVDRVRYYDVLDLAHTSGDYQPFINFIAERVEESQRLWLSVLE